MPYILCTDHVKLLQIFRKSVCLEPSRVQTAKLRQTQMLLFTAHHSCFCTSCIVPAAFTTRTCTTYHLVTAFKPLLINFCYYLLQLISSFPTVTFSFLICFRAIIPLLIDIKMLKICPGKNNCFTFYWSMLKRVHLDNMNKIDDCWAIVCA